MEGAPGRVRAMAAAAAETAAAAAETAVGAAALATPPPAAAFYELVAAATGELGAALRAVQPQQLERLLGAVAQARRLATFGVGREGLAMKGFAMRLFHAGLQVRGKSVGRAGWLVCGCAGGGGAAHSRDWQQLAPPPRAGVGGGRDDGDTP